NREHRYRVLPNTGLDLTARLMESAAGQPDRYTAMGPTKPMDGIDQVVDAFSDWARGQGIGPARAEVRVQRLGRPHIASMLPTGWQGVYSFRYDDTWLKVGKAGPKSGARWISQHYNPRSAMSTLAFSLIKYGYFSTDEHPTLRDLRTKLREIAADDIGDWIKANTERVNIL